MTERLSDRLLAGVAGDRRGQVLAAEAGIAAGIASAVTREWPVPIGTIAACARDGDPLVLDAPLLEVRGSAADLARAEDFVLGDLGVACGVATNARAIGDAAPTGLRVVCGGWKKLPAAMKGAVRDGLDAAGLDPRLLPGPFLYVDKNVVTLLGGLEAAVRTGRALAVGPVSVQVTGPDDALVAGHAGAGVVMVDTGDVADVVATDRALRTAGMRDSVQLAFGGGVDADALPTIAAAGADIVDVGRAILTRPLLDLRFVVDEAS